MTMAGLTMAGWIASLALAPPMQAGAATPCTPPPLPAALAGWEPGVAVAAGTGAAGAPMLTIGGGARATLVATNTLRYAHAPDKAAAPGSFGGLFAFTVARAGRYRVALGGGAWIDVVQGDRALISVAHDHGPACSPIRKMVDFDLTPGRYLLQVSGSKTRALPLMVATVAR
ncbi:hypothetical protein FHT00_003171 [Sphingomonas insulae]|uniref:Homogentisate 1,2-dioxygenase n=1 Tax=Sphingomonas insulae TaxID=424800 RepID=A0ABN1I1R2_9SPHN|nr:hypothetical protein [Sphingomonas insulae]NIJ31192.1 hypothetical protein [Sphingomonas insulae]